MRCLLWIAHTLHQHEVLHLNQLVSRIVYPAMCLVSFILIKKAISLLLLVLILVIDDRLHLTCFLSHTVHYLSLFFTWFVWLSICCWFLLTSIAHPLCILTFSSFQYYLLMGLNVFWTKLLRSKILIYLFIYFFQKIVTV